MYIDELVWLPQIVEKLAVKHNVSQAEVEEAFTTRPEIRFVESGERRGEDVYVARGQTFEGRYLLVYFIWLSRF